MALANAVNAVNVGIQSLTSSGVFNGITVTNTANQTSLANGDGISGNPTIALTSTIYTNISFNSGTDTLSNYSTGTYSPTISSTGTAPTVGYSVQVGRYTRIGNRLIGSTTITLSSYTAGTGTALFVLPFTAGSSFSNPTCPFIYENCTNTALIKYSIGTITNNTNRIVLQQLRSAAANVTLLSSDIGATSKFYSSFIYGV